MTGYPTGTVTFFFTDIEGSTRLWERNAVAMSRALDLHHQLLRRAITEHRGHAYKTIGDSIQAAFADPADAIAAAAAGQRALATAHWPDTGPLRVRMAIHIGQATPIDGDYNAPCLNRLARLLAAGHGGQILLTDVVQQEVVDHLPTGVKLRSLGRHRLRDLLEPEQVTQIAIEELPDNFPPLLSLERHPTNLPVQPTPLIGREQELRELADLLERDNRPEGARLVTLTGFGGVGKTRLALQAAADALESFPDGVFLVDLAPVSIPELVIPTIARALGLQESGGQTLDERLTDYLAEQRLLLVLDNFEQVIGAAPMVARLLGASPQIKALVTSREALRVRAEHEFPVPPLALPDPKRLPPPEALAEVPAVDLFVRRAQSVRPDFALNLGNARTVAEICLRLDGLPLAIELTAARVKLLAPPTILERLSNRLTLLTGGARDLPSRQQTIRATIVWSYELLEPDEQTLFRRLAVFAGGWTFDAAETIVAAAGPLSVDLFNGVESLVAKSLLRLVEADDGEMRFSMLETLREFGLERLVEHGEADTLHRAHADWYVAFAEAAEPKLFGPEQIGWLNRLETAHDNLRAALGWATTSDDAEYALRLAAALAPFWEVRGHLTEGRRWIETALDADFQGTGPTHLKAVQGGGELAFALGDYSRAAEWFGEALALARDLGDRLSLVAALNSLGGVSHACGDLDQAEALYSESLAVAREHDYLRGQAIAFGNLGAVAHYRGYEATAAQCYEESLSVWRALGDADGTASALLNLLGLVATLPDRHDQALALGEEALSLTRELGNRASTAYTLAFLGVAAETADVLDRAADLHAESLVLFREIDDRDGIARALGNLGSVAFEQGEPERAAELSAESLKGFAELGDHDGVSFALDHLAAIATEWGHFELAARWFGAADALREEIGTAVPREAERRRERAHARVEARLTPEALAIARAAGREQSVDELLREVLSTAQPKGSSVA